MNNNILTILELVIFISMPILLLIIPTSFFENGHSICLFKYFFDIECPGCGMTRALSCFFHFDFIKGIDYNKQIIIIFPLLSYLYIKHIWFLLKK